MLSSMTLRRSLVVLLVTGCLALAGCSAAGDTAKKLHGVWYEDQTGLQYDFISDTQLVLPEALSNGSNAVTYSVVDGDKISMTQADVIRVINITKLDDTELNTQDAGSTTVTKYWRSLDDTSWSKTRAKVSAQALPKLKTFPTITPKPDIVWVSAKPTDAADIWTQYPTSSIQKYATAWNWSNITPNPQYSLVASGTSGATGFAMDFNRVVPTDAEIKSFETSNNVPVIAGYQHISVGYSDGMVQYPAGTFVYINQELLYSLGDGFALRVRVGSSAAWGFAPSTHS